MEPTLDSIRTQQLIQELIDYCLPTEPTPTQIALLMERESIDSELRLIQFRYGLKYRNAMFVYEKELIKAELVYDGVLAHWVAVELIKQTRDRCIARAKSEREREEIALCSRASEHNILWQISLSD